MHRKRHEQAGGEQPLRVFEQIVGLDFDFDFHEDSLHRSSARNCWTELHHYAKFRVTNTTRAETTLGPFIGPFRSRDHARPGT